MRRPIQTSARLDTQSSRPPAALVSLVQCVVLAIEIWVNGGFEPLSVNPFFGPSGARLISPPSAFPQSALLVALARNVFLISPLPSAAPPPVETLVDLGAKYVPKIVNDEQV